MEKRLNRMLCIEKLPQRGSGGRKTKRKYRSYVRLTKLHEIKYLIKVVF